LIPAFFRISPRCRRRYLHSQAGQLAVDFAVAHSGFSRASRRTKAWMFRRVAGRPVLPCMDLAAQRRRTMSRMTSRSRFTLDEARAAGERIGVD
jgi:hypothetical protein